MQSQCAGQQFGFSYHVFGSERIAPLLLEGAAYGASQRALPVRNVAERRTESREDTRHLIADELVARVHAQGIEIVNRELSQHAVRFGVESDKAQGSLNVRR